MEKATFTGLVSLCQNKARKLFLLGSLLLLLGMLSYPLSTVQAQTAALPAWFPDSLATLKIDEVTVNAIRADRQLGALPLPVSVVSKEQIDLAGSIRLQEVLAEQTGLGIVSDHGQGLQIQGFDADYALILIDGEPLIGRTAGTLDLSRVAVGNIEQIEIIKGPSSSLYGSEALAGVINIITQDPQDLSLRLNARYGANQTANFTASATARLGNGGVYLFADRLSTAGFDFQPETFGQTAAPFRNHTLHAKINQKLGKNWETRISARGFQQVQDQAFELGDASRVGGQGTETDLNVLPLLIGRFGDKWKVTSRWYLSRYSASSELRFLETDALHSTSDFVQYFSRPEVLLEHYLSDAHVFMGGAGHITESVDADRYEQRQFFRTTYLFGQHEWRPSDRWNIITGARFDSHSDYGQQFSPKFAMSYDLTSKLRFRGSVGVGFKAPDFRQLYLNFDNLVVGYAVFGAMEVADAVRAMQADGTITNLLRPLEQGAELRAETSLSFQVGAVYDVRPNLQLRFNVFRNDIRDMIDVQPFARRTNGQFVFSYLNLGRVFTQGLELEGQWKLSPSLELHAGYQYLEAIDKDVLDRIDEGLVFRRDPQTLQTRRIQRSDYGGLFNRSNHMANVRLFYRHKSGWEGSFRANWRSRFGFGDLNGNQILDDDSEYVPGYVLTNLSVGRRFAKQFRLQLGCDNLLNFRNEQFLPNQPGRLWFVALQFDLNRS